MKLTSSGCKWEASINTSTKSLLIIAGLLAVLAAPQSALTQLEPPARWQSELLRDHELVGRIWSSADQAFISSTQFAERIAEARYLLLGEKHDNADHHALQLATLKYLLERQLVTSVAFEMIDETVMERLLDIQLQAELTLPELQAYLLWDEEGWDWDFYGPMLLAVYEAGVTLTAGNLSEASINQIYGDENAIDVTGILSAEAIARLETDIDESHCGMLPASQFPAMVRVQQSRDRAMARSLRRPPRDAMSVLIAGNYHVRQDLGVPAYLRVREPSMPAEQVVSVAFMEVQDGVTSPPEYQDAVSEQQAYDYLWFTPALTSQDYCASLQQQ